MIDLNDYIYFVYVVESKGFSQAAQRMGAPKSKVSRHIKRLEERLETRLIQRTTRQFAVTAEGRAFYSEAKKVMHAMESAENVFNNQSEELRGTINVSSSFGVSTFLLSHIINEFMALHPHVDICQHASNDYVDLISTGLDIAVRGHVENLPDSSLIQKPLATVQWNLFASPQFLSQVSSIVQPSDLRGVEALSFGWKNQKREWSLRKESGEKEDVLYSPRLISDDMNTLKMVCKQGRGVVSLPAYICQRDIEEGTLTNVLPQWYTQRASLSILLPSRTGVAKQVSAFIAFLQSRASTLVSIKDLA